MIDHLKVVKSGRLGKITSLCFTVIFVLLIYSTGYSADAVGLDIIGAVGYNARTIALGGCTGAITSDVDTIFLNPAGIGRFSSQQANVSFNRWTDGMSYESLGYITPLNAMTLGASLVYQNPLGQSPSFENISSRNMGLTLSAGRKFDDNIMMGVNAKLIQEEVDNEKSNSMVVDLAGLYNIGLAGITIGFGIQNVGSKIKISDWGGELPLNLNLGGTYSALEDTLFMGLDLNMMDGGLLVNSGIEYIPFSFLALRAGYRSMVSTIGEIGQTDRISAGVGLKIFKLNLDYAFVSSDLIDYQHIISLRAKVMMEPFGKMSEINKLANKKLSKKGSCITIDGVTMCLYND